MISAGDGDGQTAMVDAVLFMIVMLVASGLVLAAFPASRGAGSGRAELQQYASDFREAFMAVELQTGTSSWASVSRMLCDECFALRRGAESSSFEQDNAAIYSAGRNLVRPGLDFAVSCDGGAVFVSRLGPGFDGLPADRCASTVKVCAGEGIEGEIGITVYVWVT